MSANPDWESMWERMRDRAEQKKAIERARPANVRATGPRARLDQRLRMLVDGWHTVRSMAMVWGISESGAKNYRYRHREHFTGGRMQVRKFYYWRVREPERWRDAQEQQEAEHVDA